MKWLVDYFSPHKRIARKLRRLQHYLAKHNFTVATGSISDMAGEFERFKP